MKCKYCKSSNYCKNGYVKGFQRYRCKDCKRTWTMRKGRINDIEKHMMVLKLYLEGHSFRSIGRLLEISNVTVLKWIRKMGEWLFQEGALWKNANLKSVSQIQPDEFLDYVKKNQISYGYGLLYDGKQNKFLPFFYDNTKSENQLNVGGN